MGTVVRAAHPPLPRAAGGRRRRPPARAGMRTGQPRPGASTLPSRRAGSGSAPHEWAAGAVDPRGHALLERFDLRRRRCPAGAGGSATSCSSASSRCVHGRPRVAVVHRLRAPAARSRSTLDGRCAPGATRTASGAPTARRPRSSRPPAAPWSSGAYRLAGPGLAPGGPVVPRACTHREEADRGPDRRRGPWCAGPVHRRAATPGDALRVLAWAGDLAGSRRRRREVVAAARRARPAVVTRRGRPTRSTRRSRWPPTRSWSRPPTGPGRGRRLPVVRRLVARHDDLLRGAVPRHRPRRRGPRAAARVRRDAVARACSPTPPTPARSSTTPPTATLWFLHAVEPARRRHRRHRPRRRAAAARSTASSTRTSRGTRYGIRVDPADGLLTQGAAGVRADLDGRPASTGVAGHPADRQGRSRSTRCGSTGWPALAELRERLGRDAGRRCDALRARATRVVPAPVPRPGRLAVRRGRRAPDPRAATTRRDCGPTSCSPGRCRTPRCAAGPAAAARGRRRRCSPRSGLRSLAPDDPGVPRPAPRRPGRAGPRATTRARSGRG